MKIISARQSVLQLICAAALITLSAHAQAVVVDFQTTKTWSGGYKATVVINNDAATAVKGWTLSFKLGHGIKNAARANLSGTDPYSFTNVSYNESIAAGGAQNFSYTGSVNWSASGLQNCVFNGKACTILVNGQALVSSSGSSSSSSRSSSSSISSSSASSGTTPVSATNGFYIDPDSSAKKWVAANPNSSYMPTVRDKIAKVASGKWFGSWSGDINKAVNTYVTAADTADRLPILVVYNIPNRDCGSYSAGGANGGEAYKAWISALSKGIGSKPAVVILEPDALMHLDCLKSDLDRTARVDMLKYAVNQFKANATNTWVYIDAGHSNWLSAEDTATRLISAGIDNARGFALNVSNYRTSSELTAHGKSVNTELMKKAKFTRSFVLDTSRNGNGPKEAVWCDPSGRKVGTASTVHAVGVEPEMSLWIKTPGESDGCEGGAGEFVGKLAYDLALGK